MPVFMQQVGQSALLGQTSWLWALYSAEPLVSTSQSTTILKICEIHPQTLALNHFFLASSICSMQTFNSDQNFIKMFMASNTNKLTYSDSDAFKCFHEVQTRIRPWNYTSHENSKCCAYIIQLIERQEKYCASTYLQSSHSKKNTL